jgi:UDPglucose 6-dehydrogenase
VIMTEWNEFRSLDLARLAVLMTGRVIVDTRNILDLAQVRGFGFEYFCTGREQAGQVREYA